MFGSRFRYNFRWLYKKKFICFTNKVSFYGIDDKGACGVLLTISTEKLKKDAFRLSN